MSTGDHQSERISGRRPLRLGQPAREPYSWADYDLILGPVGGNRVHHRHRVRACQPVRAGQRGQVDFEAGTDRLEMRRRARAILDRRGGVERHGPVESRRRSDSDRHHPLTSQPEQVRPCSTSCESDVPQRCARSFGGSHRRMRASSLSILRTSPKLEGTPRAAANPLALLEQVRRDRHQFADLLSAEVHAGCGCRRPMNLSSGVTERIGNTCSQVKFGWRSVEAVPNVCMARDGLPAWRSRRRCRRVSSSLRRSTPAAQYGRWRRWPVALLVRCATPPGAVTCHARPGECRNPGTLGHREWLAAELREDQHSFSWIASQLGCSVDEVRSAATRFGLEAPTRRVRFPLLATPTG